MSIFSGLGTQQTLSAPPIKYTNYFPKARIWAFVTGGCVSMPGSPRLGRFETLSPASYHQTVAQWKQAVRAGCQATAWWTMPGSLRQSNRPKRGELCV